jgi:polyphosphate glucokinase
MEYGAGKGEDGLVIILTLGTGIGSALFYNGVLLPNTELGHLELNGDDAEHWAAESARQREKLKWKVWGKRVNDYMQHLDFLFSPDLYIIGGGVSKKFEKYAPYLQPSARVIPAALRNEAGIVGAALAAQQRLEPA